MLGNNKSTNIKIYLKSMKTIALFLMISILTVTRSSCQQSSQLIETRQFTGDILDFYKQYSSFTDPGDLAYLYEDLPDSLPELCSLIKSQFIHPVAELPQFRDQVPKERWNDEALKYPTVKSVLEGILSYDSRGFVKDRKPEDRLMLGCRHYAIILASILKYRGIPVRVRMGHVTYLSPGFHMSHTLCEVWNENDKRWMLVDPSVNMIDFNREEFDFSNELWLKLQNKEIDPNEYGFPGRYSGLVSIVGKVCPDLASVLGTEYPIHHYAPILEYAFENNDQLPSEQTEILNRICELMKSLDADNLSKLQDIYNNTPDIQVTRQFNMDAINTENNTEANNPSTNKPMRSLIQTISH